MKMQNQRQVYGETLVELGRENKNIVVLEADLGKSTMTCLFEKEFPERFFEMGIGEANMTSFAAGLSLTGKIAFTNSFAVFAAGRAFDQIRQSISIPKLNVKIIGFRRWVHSSVGRRCCDHESYPEYDGTGAS
jgi:transketolase